MNIILQDYEDQRLIALTACGVILEDKLGTEEIKLEGVDKSCADPVWVRLLINTQKDPEGTHFHIDTARESSFSEKPVEKNSLDAILEQIDGYRGKRVDSMVRARFLIPAADIEDGNAVSMLMKITTGENDVARLTGVRFSFDKTPVDTVSWAKQDDGGLMANVWGDVETVISKLYLHECLAPLLQTFESFQVDKRK